MQSDSKATLATHKRKTKILLIAFYAVFIMVNTAVLATFRIVITYFPETFQEHRGVFDILTIVRFVTRFVSDSFIVDQFSKAFNFMVEQRKRLRGPLSPQSEEKVRMIKLFLVLFIMVVFGQNICFTLLNLSFTGFSSQQRVLIRFLYQPVQWALQLIIYAGIVVIFQKQGRKKMAPPQPKTTVSAIINSPHDLSDGEDDEYGTEYDGDFGDPVDKSGPIMTPRTRELKDDTGFLQYLAG